MPPTSGRKEHDMTDTTYETDVDSFRRQLFMLAAKIEKYLDEFYDPHDFDERLDWLDLQRMARNLADKIQWCVESGEEDTQGTP
jgi:hypothetical protein